MWTGPSMIAFQRGERISAIGATADTTGEPGTRAAGSAIHALAAIVRITASRCATWRMCHDATKSDQRPTSACAVSLAVPSRHPRCAMASASAPAVGAGHQTRIQLGADQEEHREHVHPEEEDDPRAQ